MMVKMMIVLLKKADAMFVVQSFGPQDFFRLNLLLLTLTVLFSSFWCLNSYCICLHGRNPSVHFASEKDLRRFLGINMKRTTGFSLVPSPRIHLVQNTSHIYPQSVHACARKPNCLNLWKKFHLRFFFIWQEDGFLFAQNNYSCENINIISDDILF